MKCPRALASKPLFLITVFFCLIVLTGKAAAQGDNNPAPADNNAEATGAADTANAPEATQTNDNPTDAATTDAATTDAPTETKTDDPTNSESSQTTETSSESESKTSTENSSSTSLPKGATIPDPTVPPTEGAPYLQQSSYPEGTVFIAVGAVLGFLGLAVIAWRGLVAWSINRSVRRAAIKQQKEAAAALKPKRKRRRSTNRQSGGASVFTEKLNKNTRNSGLPTRTSVPDASLFFSPTAGAGMSSAGHRGSGYLPAGYYAAGATAPSGPGSIGLAPLGPQSQGYSRARSTGPSPPSSPALAPSSPPQEPGYMSTSSVNLTSPPQGRAPSAYLEDLFENHYPPGR